mmetsp:Transcript_83530/g.194216  ORF Transcript_83530/g.194216 Transcript_83530/m.194216 type:complete len:392 (-) Transcript_83530:490-1665(-)
MQGRPPLGVGHREAQTAGAPLPRAAAAPCRTSPRLQPGQQPPRERTHQACSGQHRLSASAPCTLSASACTCARQRALQHQHPAAALPPLCASADRFGATQAPAAAHAHGHQGLPQTLRARRCATQCSVWMPASFRDNAVAPQLRAWLQTPQRDQSSPREPRDTRPRHPCHQMLAGSLKRPIAGIVLPCANLPALHAGFLLARSERGWAAGRRQSSRGVPGCLATLEHWTAHLAHAASRLEAPCQLRCRLCPVRVGVVRWPRAELGQARPSPSVRHRRGRHASSPLPPRPGRGAGVERRAHPRGLHLQVQGDGQRWQQGTQCPPDPPLGQGRVLLPTHRAPPRRPILLRRHRRDPPAGLEDAEAKPDGAQEPVESKEFSVLGSSLAAEGGMA